MKNTFYHDCIPEWLNDYTSLNIMQRLKDVGMNCGCEYTSFKLFRNLDRYTRYDHSLGCALITWHFTHDKVQTLASLFHDVATPCFAHTIDFMNGDYLKQESTEERTEQILSGSRQLYALLQKDGISLSQISNYHNYPICDNDSPKFSCDRLEYTLGNLRNFNLASELTLQSIYDDLCICETDGAEELCFRNRKIAERFGLLSLKCSGIYVCDEDRYAMQILSEIIKDALSQHVLSYDDLYHNESALILKMSRNPQFHSRWESYCSLSQITDVKDKNSRIVFAKKRYIDPFVLNTARLSECSETFNMELQSFLSADFSYTISAI